MKPDSIRGLIAFLFLVIAPSCVSAQGDSFHLEYRDGTIVTVEFAEKQLSWTAVSDLGNMSKQLIDVSKIESLKLTLEPAGEQLATILKLIGQLDSDDFYVREESERDLRSIGKRFKSVMQRTNTLKTQDGIYRLKRVLSSLRGNPNDKSGIELDELYLKDGTRLAGDAGGSAFDMTFRGKSISVPRNQLIRLTRAKPISTTRTAQRELIDTKLFHNHADFMKDRDLKLIDFELKPNGVRLRNGVDLRPLDKNVSDDFVDVGLVLGTEYPKGCVGISGGFEVKGGDKPVGGNSVCVYQSQSGARSGKRFQGVMEITFCQPGKKNIPQGVKDVGFFLSRVNHSRDLLVEAWDSMGRLIGVCESNDEPCTFCGISSSVPIAKIRVLSNPWILELRRKNASPAERGRQRVDKDFAVDNIMFSKLMPIDSIKKTRHFFGRNGDMIPFNWVKVFGEERIEYSTKNFSLLFSDLQSTSSIAMKPVPKTMPRKLSANASWMAMLSDNSVLKWHPSNPLRSLTLKKDLAREDIVAIWPAGRQPRLPLHGDFESGNNVIVYLGCRVATPRVEFDAKGFRWSNATVKTEMLHEENEFKVDAREDDVPDDVAPKKTDYSYDLRELLEYEIPTIWFKPPTSVRASEGIIRLDGGEALVYGEGAKFQFQSLDRNQVLLSFGGEDIAIPLSKVVSILPPQE